MIVVDEAGGGKETNASQFYITTGLELDSLDGKHTIFGEVSEGLDVLQQIDEAFVDDAGRPLQNIRSVDCRASTKHQYIAACTSQQYLLTHIISHVIYSSVVSKCCI